MVDRNEQIKRIEAKTEALREAYAALNRGDVDGFVKDFDPQIERSEFLESPNGGSYHGFEAVKEHVMQGRSTWAEGGCEPERFIVAGDKIVVFVHVRVRLKNETEWLEGRAADVYTVRDGKFIQFRTFADEHQALEFAGVAGSDVNRPVGNL